MDTGSLLFPIISSTTGEQTISLMFAKKTKPYSENKKFSRASLFLGCCIISDAALANFVAQEMRATGGPQNLPASVVESETKYCLPETDEVFYHLSYLR
jgi:hypothetical protein